MEVDQVRLQTSYEVLHSHQTLRPQKQMLDKRNEQGLQNGGVARTEDGVGREKQISTLFYATGTTWCLPTHQSQLLQ